jgi:hypothetical protein
VLTQLRDHYQLMVSFNDQQLSAYKVTISKSYATPSLVMDDLLKGLPLGYDIVDGVYIIFSMTVKKKPKEYLITGRITDRTNHESLPFSGLTINRSALYTDNKGHFSHTSQSDSIFRLKISYLGYYIMDTVVASGLDYNFRLTPSVIALEKIVVTGSNVARSIQTGSAPGISKINHKIAYFLPGNGDNSIFNLLRLQPGVLAAGEQSSDLILWGSYEGQSQVIFDGFTLYGMKNFNDNISAVNPFMAKDIKVLKGAFSADYGERIGGIVDITGIDGNRLSPSAQLCVNNMTLNGLVSVPFKKKSTLVMAYRQTYYDLYNPVDFTSSGSGRGRRTGGADYYLVPDYIFRDLNLKYSGNNEKSSYYVSLYGGKDHFAYSFDQESLQRNIALDYNEQNGQLGAAAFYEFNWKDVNSSALTISYSTLQTERKYIELITRTSGGQLSSEVNEKNQVSLHEIHIRADNKILLNEKHTFDVGAGLLNYSLATGQGVVDELLVPQKSDLLVPYVYLQDNIPLTLNLKIKPGLRTDIHSTTGKIYLQPRLSAVYRFSEAFVVNTSIGMYNQFVAKNMTIDSIGDYTMDWSVCDQKDVPVLSSGILTLGLTYNKNEFTFSAEGYIKKTEGMIRYLNAESTLSGYSGNGFTRGIDIFVKKEYKGQTLWISYTLSKTEEHFSYFSTESMIPAMHDQRHEVKIAGLFTIKSLHLSLDYVFGSGFPDPALLPDEVDYNQPYIRLDASLVFRFPTRKFHLDAGISVLNLLNHENIKYSNYTRIPSDEAASLDLYAEAVPFTPALFLKIYY